MEARPGVSRWSGLGVGAALALAVLVVLAVLTLLRVLAGGAGLAPGLPSSEAPPTGVERVGSLAELDRRLAGLHLVHVRSPSMPLSDLAVDAVGEAGRLLNVPVTVLPASALRVGPDRGVGVRAETRASAELGSALIAAGATVHYPAVLLLSGRSVDGSAVTGHKRAEGYVALLRPRVRALRAGSPLSPPASLVAGDVPLPSADLRVLWRHPVAPRPGAFFRRVPGTRLIAYDQRRRVFLHHMETGRRLPAPGWIDFVPSPDGAFFVTPAAGHRGLDFYDARAVLSLAPSGEADRLPPVFVDPAMDDQYPSVGILERRPGGRIRYRVLISWFEGLAFRDYEVARSPSGDLTVRPLGRKMRACPGMGLSLPILSKDGRELAARDESTGTTHLFRLADDGGCTELADLEVQTSKVAFSDDGSLVAFSSPDPAGPGRGASRTWVLDRSDMRVTPIPESRSRGLVIPEFVGPDSLLFLGSREPEGGVEFRLVCCLR